MSISFKASPDGTYGEILVNGQVVAKLPVSGNAVIPNLVGTVSQSGGIPTGAVVERGSNANGEYVRFADGTQICLRQCAVNFNTNGFQTFPYPAVFVSTPSASYSMHTDQLTGVAAEYWNSLKDFAVCSSSLTNVQPVFRGTPVVVTGIMFILAIGRWF